MQHETKTQLEVYRIRYFISKIVWGLMCLVLYTHFVVAYTHHIFSMLVFYVTIITQFVIYDLITMVLCRNINL